jgi:hypothetical protein
MRQEEGHKPQIPPRAYNHQAEISKFLVESYVHQYTKTWADGVHYGSRNHNSFHL